MSGCFASIQPDKNSRRYHKRNDARNLRGLQDADNLTGIIAAQKLQKKSCRRVEHDVQRETLPLDVIGTAEYKQQRENHNVKLTLPNFGGEERLISVRAIGKRRVGINDSEIAAGRRAESVAVQQISATSQGLTENDSRSQNIGRG